MAYNFTPPLLTRYNYPEWAELMTRTLEAEGLNGFITKSAPKPENCPSELEKFKLIQIQTKTASLIKSYCSPDIELELRDKVNPLVIWDTLKETYHKPTRSAKIHCLAEFSNARIQPDEDLPHFIARYEELYRRVLNMGETLNEEHRCYKLIESLGDEYDYLAREFENCETSKFTFQSLKDEILKEYHRKFLRDLRKDESLVTTKGETTTAANERRCECSRQNATRNTSRNQSRTNSRSNSCSPVTRNKTLTIRNSTFITEYVPESYASDAIPPTRDWTLDSASTSHVCQNKEFFTELRPPISGSVIKMGTTPHDVKGIGTVQFTVKDEPKSRLRTVTLTNVLYVPSVHRNLISMLRMDKRGMHATLSKGFKIYSNKWDYLWSARLKDKFYVVRGIPVRSNNSTRTQFNRTNITKNSQNSKLETPSAYATSYNNNLMLWHERLGHCNIATIKKMFRENLVRPPIKLQGTEETCSACAIGKSTRAKYPVLKEVRSKHILDLLHSDIWGPAPTPSREGYRYLLTILDDFSRKVFLYPMKHKDEVYTKMKTFITYIERQTNKKIKVIRTDNGMEYCSHAMRKLLNDLGIKPEKSNVFAPQQNGAAERVNRTLLDGSRTLLEASNLPHSFWLEAVLTINYTRNRTLHSSINDIPFRRWYGRKPSVQHLKRFGCTAYVHVPQQKRNKLEPRAIKGIMIGYSQNTLGYRIWLENEDKIVESKSVTFDENILGIEKVKQKFIFEDDGDDDIYISPIPDTSKKREIPEHDLTKVDTSDQERHKNNTDQENTTDQVILFRYVKVRTSGESKGKTDIYVNTPEGKTLRSTPELKQYCQENDLEYDDSLKIFSNHCNIQGNFTIKRKEPEANLIEPEVNLIYYEEALCTELVIPKNAREAAKSPQNKYWKQAMDEEIKTMMDRKVWTPVPKTDEIKKIIGTRWVYTLKNKDQNKKFKARLVALGNNQREGLDYNETYSPVVNFTLIRILMLIFVCILQWKHGLLDVKSAYLYGKVDKDVFIAQPPNYKIPGKENYILKLNKALYGLHQSGRCWFEELHTKLLQNNFTEIEGIPCVYHYKRKAIILIYVDDLPIFAKDQLILNEVTTLLESLYEVENLGPIRQLLGIEFTFTEAETILSCEKYITACINKFSVCSSTKCSLPLQPGTVTSFQEMPTEEKEKQMMQTVPYRSLLGSLLYISGRCRPDISYAVASLSQVIQNPGLVHWNRLRGILQYLDSTKTYGLKLPNNKCASLQIEAYADASWASDPHDRRSWSGYAIFINKAPVIWRVIKQTSVAISPMEAEYIAASESVKDLKYASMIASQLNESMCFNQYNLQIQIPTLHCDNLAAIQFSKYKAENVKNRYIDLKFKFVRELYQTNQLNIVHVKSQENVADILTKALAKQQFQHLRSAFVIDSNQSLR